MPSLLFNSPGTDLKIWLRISEVNLSVCYPCPDCTACEGEGKKVNHRIEVKKKPARPSQGFSRVSKFFAARRSEQGKVAANTAGAQELFRDRISPAPPAQQQPTTEKRS
jgi:hypothetical protein